MGQLTTLSPLFVPKHGKDTPFPPVVISGSDFFLSIPFDPIPPPERREEGRRISNKNPKNK